MRRSPLYIQFVCVLATVAFASSAVAQTTIDLDEIRRQHQEGGESKDEPSADDDSEGASIQIESAGGTSTSSFGGQITLPFDKRGSSMLVPATVGGKSVYFVFDTGASYTTLTRSFAASIGASPPSDAPTMTSRTANGSRSFEFGIIPGLTLDGRPHRNVSYGVCQSCGGVSYRGKPIVGLLGLNVLRRYRIDFDHSAGEVRLEPGPQFSDRTHDVKPWLEVSRHTPKELDIGDFETAFRVENRSPRDAQVALDIQCKFGDGSRESIQTKLTSVPAGGDAILTARSGRKFCRVQKLDVSRATW